MDTVWLADYRQRHARLALELAMCQTEYRVLIADGRSVRHLVPERARLAGAAVALRREWAARQVP